MEAADFLVFFVVIAFTSAPIWQSKDFKLSFKWYKNGCKIRIRIILFHILRPKVDCKTLKISIKEHNYVLFWKVFWLQYYMSRKPFIALVRMDDSVRHFSFLPPKNSLLIAPSLTQNAFVLFELFLTDFNATGDVTIAERLNWSI